MVGGDDYATAPFNLATQGQRQPGSAFKPFVLAQALDSGISPDSTWASRKMSHLRRARKKGKCTEAFEVNNYEDAYAGVRTLRTRDDVLRQLRLRAGRHQGRHAQDRPPRAPDGHPHAGLAQLRDDARRPRAGRDAARHGARLRDVRRAAAGFTYGTMSPGAVDRKRARRARPGPGRRSSRIGQPERRQDQRRSRCPTASKAEQPSRVDWPVLKPSVADEVASILRTVVTQGTGDARPDPRHVRGRQDRHDRELRRRLVRRLDAGATPSRSGSATRTSCKPMETEFDGEPVAGGTYPGRDLAGRSSSTRGRYEELRRAGRARTPDGRRPRPTRPTTAGTPGADDADARRRDDAAPTGEAAAPAAGARAGQRRRPTPPPAAGRRAPRAAGAGGAAAAAPAAATAPGQLRRRAQARRPRAATRCASPRRRSATAARPPW